LHQRWSFWIKYALYNLSTGDSRTAPPDFLTGSGGEARQERGRGGKEREGMEKKKKEGKGKGKGDG